MARLSDEVISALSQEVDPERGEGMSQYMRHRFSFLGVPGPRRKSLLKKCVSDFRNLDDVKRRVELRRLWELDEREYQYAALDLWIATKRYIHPDDLPLLSYMIKNKQWWDTVDLLASHLIGELWHRYPETREDVWAAWLTTDDIWFNRTCLLYQLKYKKDLDVSLLRESIRKLKHKDEFFIQKAIGWSLRQYSKLDPVEVQSIVDEYQIMGLARKEALKYVHLKA